jgi:hypothetical protein
MQIVRFENGKNKWNSSCNLMQWWNVLLDTILDLLHSSLPYIVLNYKFFCFIFLDFLETICIKKKQ